MNHSGKDSNIVQTETNHCVGRRGGRRDVVLGIALFFLAFLPRAFALDRFLTPDENLWIERAAGFLDALARGDLAGTFQVGHPGVTTRWTASVGMIAHYLPQVAWKQDQLWLGQTALTDVPNHLMDVLAPTRFPTVILFSCLVVATYFLARKLVGNETAFLGAGLLALDPFCLAMSRVIHHDALNTIFMTVALLSFALWLDDTHRRWLVVSSAMAGLAFLSKATAVFLVPAVSLMALSYYPARKAAIPWKRVLIHLVLWGVIAAAVFTALWPAMWVDPVGTLMGVIEKATVYAGSPHERANFFMGQVRPDPGPLFYPVATLFRLTPVTLIGALLSFFAVWQGLSRGVAEPRRHRSLWLAVFWGFVFLFTVFMTLGAKKFDRYLLPVFPFLDLLAAAGLLTGVACIARWVHELATARSPSSAKPLRSLRNSDGTLRAVFVPTVVLALVLQGLSSLPAYPYYLTAYNPLLGGIRQAAQVLLVGWGEGYDQVAAHLNAKPGAEDLNVATWYSKQTMTYLFTGNSWDVRAYHQEPLGVFPWTQADYMVTYVSQVQREIPDRQTLSFFRSLEPEHVVNLGGLDYAEIYRVPEHIPGDVSPYQFPVGQDFGGKVRLLGYDVDDELTEFEGDYYLVITFYWQSLAAIDENYRLYLKLVNSAYDIWGEEESYPIWDGFMTAEWEPGAIIRDVHGVVVDPGTPPGSYQVTVDWLEPYTKHALPPDGGPFMAGPVAVPPRPVPSAEALGIQHPLGVDFNDKVRILGYNIEGHFRPGGNIHLVLFWQALDQFDQDYTVFVHLVDSAGRLVGQKDSEPVHGFYPTKQWTRGEVVRDQYDIPTPVDMPAGQYRIELGLYSAATGERLPVDGREGDKVVLTVISLQP